MSTEKFFPIAVCALCQTKIRSESSRDFQRCKCGAIFIDGGPHVNGLRLGGHVCHFDAKSPCWARNTESAADYMKKLYRGLGPCTAVHEEPYATRCQMRQQELQSETNLP